MEYSTCREHGTKKKSVSPTGIEPMTFCTPVGLGSDKDTRIWTRILLGSAMSKCPIGDK